MRTPTGYKLGACLSTGPRTEVHAALCLPGGGEVVLKRHRSVADASDAASCERERTALQLCAGPGIARVLDACDEDPGLLVLERMPGVPLPAWIRAARPSLDALLQVALALSATLARVHAARWIHCSVRPDHVLVDPDTLQIGLVGFGRARRLGSAHAPGPRSAPDESALEALPYVAPEQTGRMDRGIDSRSDLYALGATLYFALTGQPPFTGSDPLVLVHAHMARPVQPPGELRADLPAALSCIVVRLLQKGPADRYPLASSLHADLQRCLDELQRTGAIPDDLPLGSADAPHRPLFTRRLHGRSAELAILSQALAQASAGTPTAVRVRGGTGIGKSALLDELRSAIAPGQACLGRGKFDPYRRAQPFLGFMQALSEVARQLLSESDARLAQWRERLRIALGGSTAVITGLVPAFGLVLGDASVPPRLGPRETRLRLGLAVRRLAVALARTGHPLVLVLDDLQWMDAGSSDLLFDLLLQVEHCPLLLVCAERDDEPDAQPALDALWLALRPHVALHTIALGGIEQSASAQMLADALGRPEHETRSLAICVGRKTGNTPLWIQQFVYHLYDTGLIRFQAGVGWTWEQSAVAAAKVPDSAVGLVAAKIERLTESDARVLGLAACIGDRFELTALSELDARAPHELSPALLALCDEGLIAPDAGAFRFTHDRIRESAQARLGAPERARLHGRALQLLLAQADPREPDARIFEIADHLEAARAAGGEPLEPGHAVSVHVRAAQRALASGATGTALRYFEAGRACLGLEPMQEDPGLAFQLLIVGAEAAYQCKRFHVASRCLEELIAQPLSPMQRARVHSCMILVSTATRSHDETCALALRALHTYGVRLPLRPSRLRVWLELWRTERELGAPDALEFPACEPGDLDELAPLLVMNAAAQALSATSYRSICIASAISLRVLARHGVATTPSISLAAYAAYRIRFAGCDRTALAWARASSAWLERNPHAPHGPRRAMIATGYIDPWTRPRHPLAESLRRIRDSAQEVGDFETASQAEGLRVGVMLHAGHPLGETVTAMERSASAIWTYAQSSLLCSGSALLRVLTHDEDLDAALATARRAVTDRSLYLYTGITATFVLLVMGETQRAFEEAEHSAREVCQAQCGTRLVDFTMLHGLCAAILARGSRGRARRKQRAVLDRAARRLQRWARHGPDFTHMHALLEAERRRLRGDSRGALALYAQAAEQAHASRHGHHAALAHEQRAELLLELGRGSEAVAALRRSLALTREWGARAKERLLLARLEQLARTEEPGAARPRRRLLPRAR